MYRETDKQKERKAHRETGIQRGIERQKESESDRHKNGERKIRNVHFQIER